MFTLNTCDLGIIRRTQSYPVPPLHGPIQHWSNSATQIITTQQLNVQTGKEQLLSGIKNDPIQFL